MQGTAGQTPAIAALLESLGCQLIVRGWLSANSVLFAGCADPTTTVVDSGYDSHSDQTVALLEVALRGRSLGRIINTHLHSDHCGGNAALQSRWACDTWVPAKSFDAAACWSASALSFEALAQKCKRFRVDRAIAPGDEVLLGGNAWIAIEAPGHDPQAMMFFEPRSRTLISGDALWEQRLAIIFPELIGDDGFAPALAVLDRIARLAPALVIPGHGEAFTAVAAAIASSRRRLEQFQRAPQEHVDHAVRALLMFHMLEYRERSFEDLTAWTSSGLLYQQIAARSAHLLGSMEVLVSSAISHLETQGKLERTNGLVRLVD